jgi:tetratricopeptide (TPR) repeat protein
VVFLGILGLAGVFFYKFYSDKLAQLSFQFSLYWVEKQKFNHALFWMEHAFRLQPVNPNVLHQMGVVHQALGHNGQAMDYFYLAQLQHPDNAIYAYNIGVAEYELGHYEVAITHWFNALQYAETVDVDVYYCMGAAYEALNNWPAAIEVYRQALDVAPDHSDTLHALATSFLEVGELHDALAYAKRYAEQQETAEAYNLILLIHHESGNLEQALEAATTALGLDPDHAETLNNYAVLKTQELSSNLSESADLLKYFETDDPSVRQFAQYNLMVIQGLNNEYSEASTTLADLLKHPMDEQIKPSIMQAKLIIQHQLAEVNY